MKDFELMIQLLNQLENQVVSSKYDTVNQDFYEKFNETLLFTELSLHSVNRLLKILYSHIDQNNNENPDETFSPVHERINTLMLKINEFLVNVHSLCNLTGISGDYMNNGKH